MMPLIFDDVWMKEPFFDKIVAGYLVCVGVESNRSGRPLYRRPLYRLRMIKNIVNVSDPHH